MKNTILPGSGDRTAARRPRLSPGLVGLSAFLLPTALLVILFITGSASADRELRAIAADELRAELHLARGSVNDRLQASLQHLQGHVDRIEEAGATGDRQLIERELTEVRKSDEELSFVALYSPDGRGLARDPPLAGFEGQSFTKEAWYLDYTRGAREPTISDTFRPLPTSKELVTGIALPLFKVESERSPILLGGLHLRSIQEWLSPFRIGRQGGLVLADRHNRIIASSAGVGLEPGDRLRQLCTDCLTRDERTFGDLRVIAFLPESELEDALADMLLIPLLVGLGLVGFAGAVSIVVGRLVAITWRQREEVARAKAQVERNFLELEEGLLSRIVPIPGWGVGAAHASASEGARVGGDFFDVFRTKSGRLAVIVGDVSGKGIEAAATASTARTAARTLFQSKRNPASVLASLNEYLLERIPEDLFVTMLIGLADDRGLELTSAGHPLPLVAGPDEGASPVAVQGETGLPLGLLTDVRYVSFGKVLPSGYTALFFTDGLIEARVPGGPLLGIEGARDIFGQALKNGLSAQAISEHLRKAAVGWSAGRLLDDLAVITIRPDRP